MYNLSTFIFLIWMFKLSYTSEIAHTINVNINRMLLCGIKNILPAPQQIFRILLSALKQWKEYRMLMNIKTSGVEKSPTNQVKNGNDILSL